MLGAFDNKCFVIKCTKIKLFLGLWALFVIIIYGVAMAAMFDYNYVITFTLILISFVPKMD